MTDHPIHKLGEPMNAYQAREAPTVVWRMLLWVWDATRWRVRNCTDTGYVDDEGCAQVTTTRGPCPICQRAAETPAPPFNPGENHVEEKQPG